MRKNQKEWNTMKKVALITGGSRGIGAVCVQRLTRDGFQVAFCYHESGAAARALAAEIGRAHV